MRVVGTHLANHALKLPATDVTSDLFARSAFSRYYYDIFLQTKTLLIEIEVITEHDEVQHEGLPKQLQGTVKKGFLKAINSAHKTGQLAHTDFGSTKAMIISGITDLASLLSTARPLRVVADYWLNQRVIMSGTYFSLLSVRSTDADQWSARAARSISSIKKGWDKLGKPPL